MSNYLVELERQNRALRADLAAMCAEKEATRLELAELNHTVAHELRQPLNVIYAYGQAILMTCEDLDDDSKEHLQGIIDGTLRLDGLIGALSNYSRLGNVALSRKRVDLSALARGVMTRLTQGDPQRQVEQRIAEGVSAQADYDLMAMVMEHLLGNAWKFTGLRGDAVVEFGVREDEEGPAYFVRDNGVGFEPAEREQIFLPFRRGSGLKKLRGFGLGLATVARIIERHGGTVWAEGAPGEGAGFYFTL